MSTEFKLRYHNSFIDVEFPAVEEGLHARAQSLSPHRKGYKPWPMGWAWSGTARARAAGSELCSLPLGKAGFFEPRVLEDPILHHFRRSIHFCWENRFSVPTRCQRCQRDQWCTPGKSWECWAPRVMPPPMPSFHLWLLWSWEQLQLFVMRRILRRQQNLTRGREKSPRTCTAKRQLLWSLSTWKQGCSRQT